MVSLAPPTISPSPTGELSEPVTGQQPSLPPSVGPSSDPRIGPTRAPSVSPRSQPSSVPSLSPSGEPSVAPLDVPTDSQEWKGGGGSCHRTPRDKAMVKVIVDTTSRCYDLCVKRNVPEAT